MREDYEVVIFDMGGVLLNLAAMWTGTDELVVCLTSKLANQIGRKHAPINVFSGWLPEERDKVIVYEDMMRAVATLKRKGYRTALLTNNFFIDEQRKRPTVHVDTTNFDVVVESCRVGICKPSEQIYKIVLDRLGVSGDKCIFLDDSKKFCIAANKLGITSVHVNAGDTGAALKRLEELLHITLI
ncbi:unnamed protein product [Toxocara canis]|uniref:HAD family phosphatase n=1 Tax=Toxocara canis TaxID=6265 RepID=A0A183VDN8_TOXCA|nr:unnamed protein product [Toxocara canis]